ncbi:uncharacterized protein LOC132037237 [Lycium ferocissimum]|uniref:uncharacterized protein LOC132037237 n=1 Tax=Lycium ferocissimum TaxID=112874 RepID=UPI0028151D4C|nr:uncharacterized protein LOC132037237 [Lycium ferocissimum]
MFILHEYERVSRQKINADKSCYYIHKKVADGLSQEVQQITGFTKGDSPFTYLGCPIFHARRQKIFYKDILKKVRDKLQAWKGKLLSFGGKAVLISCVLQSIPVYLLSAMVPPKCVIKEPHKLFNRFFWQTKHEGTSKHWSAWENLCYPKNERGLGFRSLYDISKALFAKIWWRFRTSGTLWSKFMWNKYCKRFRPTVSKLGAFHELLPHQEQNNEIGDDLEDLMDSSHWNYAKMQDISNEIDNQWWIHTSSGKFTVKSAWERLRQRKQRSQVYKNFWLKGLPYKISMFLWRVWFWKLPINEVLQKMRINIVSRCWSCHVQKEIMDHVFITRPFARRIWSYFPTAAGIMGPFIQIKQTVLLWWSFNPLARLKALYQAIPALVMWQLWKDRNTRRHGGSVSYVKVKWKFPRNGHFKCNTDRVSRGNLGPSSAAFCVRNSSGDFLYAMERVLPDTTNLVAEAVAIEEGIKYCISHDLFPLIIETDSLTTQKILDGIWDAPWSISLTVRNIQRWRKDRDVIVKHVLREGSCAEDFFTNLVFDFAGTIQYDHF